MGYITRITNRLIALLLRAKAIREEMAIDEPVNKLLSKAIGRNIKVLFKGRHFRIVPDLFA